MKFNLLGTQNNETPEFLVKTAGFINTIIIRLELSFISLCLIGLIIKHIDEGIGGILVSISLSSLAIVYFSLSFKKTIDNYDHFIVRMINYSYSVSAIGILFILQIWPLGIMMHTCALSSMVLSLLFIFILGNLMQKLTVIGKIDVFRTIIILIIVSVLIFTPEYKEVKKRTQKKDRVEHTK